MVSENVQTDAAVAVDVGVVDAGGEVDLGRLEGVVCGEVDGEEEDTARVWGVTLRTISHVVTMLVVEVATAALVRRQQLNQEIEDLQDP